jgi:hypothetical protein
MSYSPDRQVDEKKQEPTYVDAGEQGDEVPSFDVLINEGKRDI